MLLRSACPVAAVAWRQVFLVYINDLLSTGYIADLFTPEDKENFCNAVRNECKAAGMCVGGGGGGGGGWWVCKWAK